MQVADIATHRVVDIIASASVQEAARAMRTGHVGALVVVERHAGKRAIVGIITDRDIAIAVVAAGVPAEALTVGDVMSRHVATCTEDQDLSDAIGIMRERGVRRLPVLDSAGALSAVLTADDVYGALGTHMRDLSRALVREQARETEIRK